MKIGKKTISDTTVTNVLYITAIVAVVAVLVLAAIAFASRRSDREDTGETSITTKTVPTTGGNPVKGDDAGQNDDTGDGGETGGDKGGETGGETGGEEPTTVIVNEPIEFVMPCIGFPSKTYDMETLTYSLTMNDYRTHSGIDIEAAEGTAVLACADGRVSACYYDYMMGYCIEIDHGDGFISVYKNLSSELPEGIEEGAQVSRGDVIGAVGSSALVEQAEEPHLHFELKVEGTNVDPLQYIELTEETMSSGIED